MDEPEQERDDERDDAPEPTVASLVWRGILVVIFAFIAANWILIVHAPIGH